MADRELSQDEALAMLRGELETSGHSASFSGTIDLTHAPAVRNARTDAALCAAIAAVTLIVAASFSGAPRERCARSVCVAEDGTR